jgi:hypothetical protein
MIGQLVVGNMVSMILLDQLLQHPLNILRTLSKALRDTTEY